MQNAAELNVPLPIGLNNTARFTGTRVTPPHKNVTEGGGIRRAEGQHVDNREWDHHRVSHLQGHFYFCLLNELCLAKNVSDDGISLQWCLEKKQNKHPRKIFHICRNFKEGKLLDKEMTRNSKNVKRYKRTKGGKASRVSNAAAAGTLLLR